MTDKKSKLKKIDEILGKVDDSIDIAQPFVPPGVRGRVQDVEDAVKIGREGLGLFARIKAMWKRKK